MDKTAVVTITRSSHPEFDFFADLRDTTGGASRQLAAMRGSRTEVDAWADQATRGGQGAQHHLGCDRRD